MPEDGSETLQEFKIRQMVARLMKNWQNRQQRRGKPLKQADYNQRYDRYEIMVSKSFKRHKRFEPARPVHNHGYVAHLFDIIELV